MHLGDDNELFLIFILIKLLLTTEDLSILSCGSLYSNFKNLNISCSFLNILFIGTLTLSL